MKDLAVDDDDDKEVEEKDWGKRVLKDALEEALNDETVATTFAETLAETFDARLAAGAAVDVDGPMKLFRLTRSKDVFEAHYRASLGRRLLAYLTHDEASRTALLESLSRERSVVSIFERECGNSYVTKLEGMCKDAELSGDVTSDYDAADASLDLAPAALTTGYWPKYAKTTLKLPPPLAAAQDHFEAFYFGKFQGRRLSWHHDLERAVVRASYSNGGPAKLLEASLPQALVLLALDGGAPRSASDIAAETGLEADDLVRVLTSLTSPKLALVLRRGADGTVAANPAFEHPKVRIKVPAPQVTDAANRADRTKVVDSVRKDRQYAIDATIVRVMKARKTLSHQMLLADLLAQLKHPATTTQIKDRLESLIEREYLERDPVEPSSYNYLA